jgi:DNA-binding CsgD family transcriptional regulator
MCCSPPIPGIREESSDASQETSSWAWKSSSITEMEAQLDTITQRSAERIPWMADSLPAVKAHELEGPDPAIDMLKRQGMHHRRGGIPWFLAMAGRIAEAQTMASVFVAAAESAAAMGNWVRSAVGHAYQGLANAAAIRGEPSEARSAFERGRQLYASLDHHAAIGFSLLIELHECAIPFETRDVARRKKLAGAAAAALGRAGGTFPPGLSPERANLSIHFLEGHWDTARAIADDVPIHGTVLLRREVTTNISAIARAQGRLDEAWELVHLALPKGVDTIPGSTLFPESTELQLTAAHLSLDEGNLVQAREWLDAHDRWMAWSGAVLGRAEGLTGWARYYHSAGDEQEAMRFAAEALAAASEPDQPLATIAALRQFGELEASANHPDRSVAHLREALALAITCELVYEEALTRASLALVYQATNDLAATNEELRPARSIAERLDARPLLERLAGIARETTEQIEHIPAGLTPREIQVLRLVAQGMTDAAIGEALFISTRTASQHLRSIYSKLNVSSRAAATRFAIEHGLA